MAWASGNIAVIENGHLRPKIHNAWVLQARAGALAADQFAEADFVTGAYGQDSGVGIALRVTGNTGYFARHNGAGWWVQKLASGTVANLGGVNMASGQHPSGTAVKARLEVRGTTLRLMVGGMQVWTGTDATISSGQAGILAQGSQRSEAYITTFHTGNL